MTFISDYIITIPYSDRWKSLSCRNRDKKNTIRIHFDSETKNFILFYFISFDEMIDY